MSYITYLLPVKSLLGHFSLHFFFFLILRATPVWRSLPVSILHFLEYSPFCFNNTSFPFPFSFRRHCDN